MTGTYRKLRMFDVGVMRVARLGLKAAVLAAACFTGVVSQAAYVQVYNTIQKGALTFTGNTLELGGSASGSGVPGKAATGGAFIAAGSTGVCGSFPAGTTCAWASNASRAVLSIPPGAKVLYAELIWSGTIGAGTVGTTQLSAAQMNSTVKFTTPSGTVYTISPNAITAGNSGTYYTRSSNVTGFVQLGGAGTYTTGGVPAGTNASSTIDAAGWTLAVAYSDASQPARNLTIFVGAEQAGAPPASVSGFCTPVSGPVNGRLLVSGVEGDSSGTGDTMLFGPTSNLGAGNRLSGTNNPLTNFFASQINGDLGTLNTTGSFGTSNSTPGTTDVGTRQGYDITNVDASPQLLNSQTNAFAQGTTSGDNYAINALGMQINVTSPVFPITVKTASKTSIFAGGTLTYNINLDNTAGNGAANNVVFFDNIPPGMVLIPNSFKINGVTQAGADPALGVAVGNVPAGAVVNVSFDVSVVSLPASPASANFANSARWTYTYIACGGVVAQAAEITTSQHNLPAARLEPVKSVSPTGQLVGGQLASYTISMPNTGLLDTSGTTLADPIPAGTVYIAGSTRLNGVAVPDGPGGTMPFATAALVNSPGRAAGVIAFGAAATVQFQVAALSGGTVLNTATIDPDGSGPGTSLTVSAVNSGLNGPSVSKAFVPATIAAGGQSLLTVVLTNPNAAAITGVSVTDNLPSGMTIASPLSVGTTCTGASAAATVAGTTLGLTGATIPASGSCSFSANVTAASPGVYTNIIAAGAVSSANAGASTAGSQSLNVTTPPSIAKSFTPGTVAPNTAASLTIILSNPTTITMTGATFTDVFPSTLSGAPGNMTLFDTLTANSCGGSLADAGGAALAVGASGIKLVAGTIPPNNVCVVTVNVKANAGGSYFNSIPAGALNTSGGSNTAAAVGTLQVASPVVDKAFASNTVAGATPVAMTVTLTNITGVTITSLAFTDNYPSGLTNSNTTVANTCGGTAIASASGAVPNSLTLSGGTLAPGSSCSVSVNVQSALAGSYINTIAAGSVTSSIGPNAASASATLNVARPSISKAFSAGTMPLNGTALLTITLSNPTGSAMTGAAFTDNLPSGLTAASPGGTCVGTKTASGSVISLSGGTIPANGSCTVIAVITGTTTGLKINTIPAGSLTVAVPAGGSNGVATTDDISVLAPPTVAKSFATSPILPNTEVSSLEIVLQNSNAVALTNTTFIDKFPTTPGAMTVADLSTTNSCGGTLLSDAGAALAIGSAGIKLVGGTIPSNGSCVITVNVKAAVAGDYVNTIPASPTAGFLSTANAGGNTVAASAPLAVRLTAPTLVKSFAPGTIVANTPSTMTLVITNPSAQAITGAQLSDIFPSGMKVFTTPNFSNSCGGTVSSGNAAGDGSFGLSGATVPANGSCTVTMQVTGVITAAAPGLVNTTGKVTSINANASNVASASLIVTAAPPTSPTIAKAFGPTSIGAGDVSTITFTLGSANTSILTNANFTDTLLNMSVASASIGGTCVGVSNSPALLVGATALNLTVPNLAPGGCTVAIAVTSSNLGVNPNTVSGVVTTQTPTAGAGAGPVTLTVFPKPTITKAFGTPSILTGGTSSLVFTLGNSNATAFSTATFSDTLTNMSISSAGIGGTCVGVTNTPALAIGATGVNALNLTVPNLPSGGCTVIVAVTSNVAGTHPNTVTGVATAQTPTPGLGFGPVNLTVTGAVSLTVTKAAITPSIVNTASGTTAAYSITVTNPSAYTATSVKVTDTLPSGFSYASTSSITLNGNNVAASNYTVIGVATPLWDSAPTGGFSIAPNQTLVISFVANVTSTVANGKYDNSASVVAGSNASTIANFDGSANSTDDVTISSAVLVVKKVATSSVVVLPNTGTTASYVITVSNTGTAAATGVIVTDTLPARFFYDSTVSALLNGSPVAFTASGTAAVPQWDSNPAGGFTIPAGQSLVITFNASLAGNGANQVADGTYHNAVSATGVARSIANYVGGTGPGTTDALSGVVVTSARIIANKSTTSPVLVNTPSGATATYKITILNNGTGPAARLKIFDALPAGFSYVSTSNISIDNVTVPVASYTASVSGSTITWDTNPAGPTSGFRLGGGSSLVISFLAKVTNTLADGVYNNSVSTSSNAASQFDYDGSLAALNTDNVTIVSANLAVNKTTSTPGIVNSSSGTSATYTIVVTNNGGGTATGVSFSDSLPSGFTFAANSVPVFSGGAVQTATLNPAVGATVPVWGGFAIPPAGSVALSFAANVSSTVATGTYGNSASITNSDAKTISNFVNGANVTVGNAILSVNKTTSTPRLNKTGLLGTATYTITVSNSGNAPATGVKVSDSLPTDFSYGSTSSVLLSGSPVAFTAAGTAGVPLWDSNPTGGFTIPAGQSLVITFNATVASTVAVGVYQNDASATGVASSITNYLGSSSTQEDVAIVNAAIFTLSKTHTGAVTKGSTAVYNLVVTNTGLAASTGTITITDTLPVGLSFASSSNPGVWSCAAVVQVVTCNSIGLVLNANGDSSALNITVNVPGPAANVVNSATVSNAAGIVPTSPTLDPTTIGEVTGVALSGMVYNDLNHNLLKDGNETGTGLALFAKLVPAATPAGPAIQAVAVNPATGLYQFAAVQPGEYIIVIDDNNTVADVVPTIANTWIGTEMPDQIRQNVVVAGAALQQLNFGLFNGNKVTGKVFIDNGTGIVGVANNGVQDGNEVGLPGVTVKLTDGGGATVYDSNKTDGAGNYQLWLPALASGTALKVSETNLSGYVSTGGNASGLAGVSYDRTTDVFSLNFTPGLAYSGLNFGDVPPNTLVADHQLSALPGNVVFYAHAFTAGSAGEVTFSPVSSAGWPQIVYVDTNCDGLHDPEDPPIRAPVPLVANEKACVLMKVTVPAGTPFNAQDATKLGASFVYANAAGLTSSLSNTDLTTVGAPTNTGLVLVKSLDNAAPLPGANITYTITYTNNSSGSLSNIVINDAVLSYTSFVSASCVNPPPSGIVCSVSSQPTVGGTGSVAWALTGPLTPGASGQVAFTVQVNR